MRQRHAARNGFRALRRPSLQAIKRVSPFRFRGRRFLPRRLHGSIKRIEPPSAAGEARLAKPVCGGRVIQYTGSTGRLVHEWIDTDSVNAMAYDIPVPGYRNHVVNTLRFGCSTTST